MLNIRTITFAVLISVLLSCKLSVDARKGKGTDPVQRYQLADNWPDSNIELGNPTGVGIRNGNELVVFHRAGRTWPLTGIMPESFITKDVIFHIDTETGKLKRSWGKDLFIMPHGLTVDTEGNIWLTDVAMHQVFKFNADGKLLLSLGEAGKPGDDTSHFDLPTDVAIAADGSFYVSDGYGNSRVIKFSSTGKYLFSWGKKGDGPGEFDIPHGIDLDEAGNVYVADRENRRIQVFTAEGKFIREWSNKTYGYMCSVAYDPFQNKVIAVDDDRLITEHKGSDVFVFSKTGSVENRFGRSGMYNGAVSWYHDVVSDQDGNIYIGDILNNKVQKFRLIQNR